MSPAVKSSAEQPGRIHRRYLTLPRTCPGGHVAKMIEEAMLVGSFPQQEGEDLLHPVGQIDVGGVVPEVGDAKRAQSISGGRDAGDSAGFIARRTGPVAHPSRLPIGSIQTEL